MLLDLIKGLESHCRTMAILYIRRSDLMAVGENPTLNFNLEAVKARQA